MIFMWIILAVLAGLIGYVRLAPSDPAHWHVARDIARDRDLDGGVLRVVEAGPDGLARLDAVARTWPRTRVLAGSVEEGMITYVSRSALWGFPDYTTVRQVENRLEIFARLRFGRKDFGVNRKRTEAWLAKF
jgi:hypothetical protein